MVSGLNCAPEMPHHAGTMKRLFFTYIPALVSAVLLAWCFPSYHLHWLAWVALLPLLLRTADFSPAKTALHFYLCAHLFHTLVLQWLWANIFWAGGWAIIGQQALCVILSLCWAVTGFVWSVAHARSPRLGGALCLAGLWAGMELFQSVAFTGFGWCGLGYTQGANLRVAQWASLGGVILVSFLIVLVNALLALGLLRKELWRQRLVCVPAVLILVHLVGHFLLGPADYESKPFRVGVVQPNFSQEMKWDPAYDYEMLQRTAQMTRTLASRSPFDLAVWPEALIVRHFENPVFMESLALTAKDAQSYILTGAVREDYATSKSYNSCALVGPDGKLTGYYDKVRLAAFGEYIPFEKYLPFLRGIAFGGVDAGEKQTVFPVKEREVGPLICFEVLFPSMAEKLRRMGADALVVMTNLAWFGGSCAIAQELEIARMRAIETRLPLVHSANTGISGVFDPYGRFSVVRQTVSAKNDLVDWGDAVLPRHAVMRRFVGEFPLAAAGRQPIPRGPAFIPWLLLLTGVAMTISTFFTGTFNRLLEEPYEPPRKPLQKRVREKPAPEKKTPEKAAPEKKAPEKEAPEKKLAEKKTTKRKSKKKVGTPTPEQEELF